MSLLGRTVLCTLLVAACGGTTIGSLTSVEGGTAGASTGTGGVSGGVGGSTDNGGAVGVGGAAGGNAGSSGAGGTSSSLCALPQVSGNCDAYMPSYWFDAKTGVCELFVYGGCGGNANRFATVDECYAACAASAPADVTGCSAPSDCIVSSPSCCGACDMGDAMSFVAIRGNAQAAYRQEVACGSVACGACPPPAPMTHTAPYFGATCRGGRCVLYDARTIELTACTLASDCTLRNGLGCCERCGESPETLIAVNRSVPLPQCAGAPACPPCVATYGNGWFADCVGGRCAVVGLLK
jgi:hypothetical protein